MHYEDDGVSQAYVDEVSLTKFSKRSTSSRCVVEISASEGRYVGMPEKREYIIVMGGLDRKPSSVILDGDEKLECSYNSETYEASFTLPSMGRDEKCKIEVRY